MTDVGKDVGKDDAQASTWVHVGIARFQIKPGYDREFAEGFKRAIATAPPNPDKLQFEIYREASDVLRFVLYQTFTNAQAWEAHRTSPHSRTNFLASQPSFANDPERSVWTPVKLVEDAIQSPDRDVVGHAALSIFRATESSQDELLDQIRFEAERRKANMALFRFDLSRNVDDALRFVAFARWRNRSAWDEDRQDSGHVAFCDRVKPHLDGPVEHTLLSGRL